MFVGRKEETSPAAQITPVGHVIDGTADIKSGYLPVAFMPSFIQKGTDGLSGSSPK